jgi:hypothetical protein
MRTDDVLCAPPKRKAHAPCQADAAGHAGEGAMRDRKEGPKCPKIRSSI